MNSIIILGLDETTLALCVRLCENGVNPDALAKVVMDLQSMKNEDEGRRTPSDFW